MFKLITMASVATLTYGQITQVWTWKFKDTVTIENCAVNNEETLAALAED